MNNQETQGTANDVDPASVDRVVMPCVHCNGTGWRPLQSDKAKVCEHCCKHDQGWWELTEHYEGFVDGGDNRCCLAGCGTMARDT